MPTGMLTAVRSVARLSPLLGIAIAVGVVVAGISLSYAGASITSATTSTTIDSSQNPSIYGQSTTLTATVSSAGSTPTGTVTFFQAGTTLGNATLTSGVANFDVASLGVGTHTVTAVYNGNANFATSTSLHLTQTVDAGSTTTTISADPNPATPGQSVTFAATVTAVAPAMGTPTGTITFNDGDAILGTARVLNGKALLRTSELAIGSHSVRASFAASKNFKASRSTAATIVVQGLTTTTLNVSPNPAKSGRAVILAATVAPIAPATGMPIGTVTFYDSGTILGTARVLNGIAHLRTAGLTIGNHPVTASFGGSKNFAASQSSTSTVMVDPRIGSEFRVNTFIGATTSPKQNPAIAPLAGGGFVVVWESWGQDGYGCGVVGQRFSADGKKLGHEFRINKTIIYDQKQPAVAGLAGGGFVVVWSSDQQDGLTYDVLGQMFNADGTKLADEFWVNSTTAMDQAQPSVAGLNDGGYVVVWSSDQIKQTRLDIYGQRYDAGGATVGGEFLVNTSTKVNAKWQPTIAALASGFVVAWSSNQSSQFGFDIYSQRFDGLGAKLGTEFLVNTSLVSDQSDPSMAALNDGGFVITWTSSAQDTSGLGVYAQRFNAAGAKKGNEFRVNTFVSSEQFQSSVASFSDGGFVVVWASLRQDGSDMGIYGQAYNAAGAPMTGEFRVNTTITNDQTQPRVAAFSGGNCVVVWASSDISPHVIDGQRLQLSGP